MDKLVELHVIYVSVFGGEPALHPQLSQMIGYAKSRKRRVYLNTDITASTSERLTEMVAAGTDVLSFSLDGATRTKDNKRAISDVDERLNALLAMRDKGYPFALHCNITWHKGNLAEGREVVRYLHEKGPIGISVRLAVYPRTESSLSQNASKLALRIEDADQVRELADWLIERKRQGYRILNPPWYLTDLSRHLEGDHRWDCGAMRDILSIDTDGSVTQCSYYLPSAPFGQLPLHLTFDQLTPANMRQARAVVVENLKNCNSACVSPAYCGTSHFRRHRVELLRTFLRV